MLTQLGVLILGNTLSNLRTPEISEEDVQIPKMSLIVPGQKWSCLGLKLNHICTNPVAYEGLCVSDPRAIMHGFVTERRERLFRPCM